MQSCTRYLDGKKFETLIGGHRIVSDQPVSGGGTDAGVTPPELLLASLGACAGHYAAEYLRTRSLPLTGLQVHVSAEKGTQPARLASFRIEVDIERLDERHRQGLLRAVQACLIHNTLTRIPVIEVEISSATQAVSLRGCTALAGGASVASL
jgi:putative redox protein